MPGYLRDAALGSVSFLDASVWNILYPQGFRNFGATTFTPIRASNGDRERRNPSWGETTMWRSIRLLWLAVAVLATGAVLVGDQGGGEGGGMNIDLAVRQVTVSPVRAHAGDVIRVEVVIENKAEG